MPLSFFIWWSRVSAPVDKNSSKQVLIVIPQGLGVEEIGNVLKEKGLIRSVLAFRLLVIKENMSQNLQAGDFHLSPSMNMFDIAQNLTHGTLDIWVTIPEGLRREEIATILSQGFLEQGLAFSQKDFVSKTSNLEGYLFPDTYLIPKTAVVEEVINILTVNFEQKFSSLNIDTSLTKEQTVILASLIEREAKYDKDRKLVAGILLKRLKKGWPLQVDAALQYVKGSTDCTVEMIDCNWWSSVSPQDLKAESFYNTYELQGLPPAPICNPGLASLKAAANPQNSEYWFYLSDPSGNTYYSVTNKEHNEKIEKYLN
jgi:UPF0755 protein